MGGILAGGYDVTSALRQRKGLKGPSFPQPVHWLYLQPIQNPCPVWADHADVNSLLGPQVHKAADRRIAQVSAWALAKVYDRPFLADEVEQ